ncbi:NifB/NifX family molybdenum-iron cluster-binding protein [Candidatus Sumerlaeota bacterium]|nr:NifB/NifX family molybdenum-iron cluster-binding protein [Candidatus Sumerlaeota bacterium]
MKVAISASADSLDANVDPRFGRCASLLIVDTETGEIVGGGRNAFASEGGGAGTQAAQWVIEQGAEAVLTGNLGPNAFQVLRAGKVRCLISVSGSVRDALAAFGRGELREASSNTVPPHSGMG